MLALLTSGVCCVPLPTATGTIMADSSDSVVETPGVTIAPGSSESAPFIYFDGVPTFGTRNGAIQIELAANTILPDGKGVKIDVVMTAHLRCSPAAAGSLRKTIDKALALLQQEQQQFAESAQGSKPN